MRGDTTGGEQCIWHWFGSAGKEVDIERLALRTHIGALAGSDLIIEKVSFKIDNKSML